MSLPVLLPPEDEAPRGLPPVMALVAAIGVAVLGLVTVPATLERRRLDRVHAQLGAEIRDQEEALERLERVELLASQSSFLREAARRRLLSPPPPR